MGNGCSKNLRRLNKDGVKSNHNSGSIDARHGGGVDNDSLPSPYIITSKPIEESHKSHATHNKIITSNSKANCIEIGPGDNHESFNGSRSRLQIASSHETPSTSRIGKTDKNNTFCSRSSSSNFNFIPDDFNLSSCIDTKSIIFDKTELTTLAAATRPSYTTRSMSVDKFDGKRFATAAAHLHRLFKSNQNLPTTTPVTTSTPTASTPTTKTNGSGSISFPKLYHRLSGSVSSLFTNNLQNNRKRNLSASDTNLNRINGRSGFSQQQLIDNDYCPSVFYNRKARKSLSEKNLDKTQTFSRWKNQLWLKFSRKKSNPSARKS